MERCGILLETKRFAVHDGPGIRTAFFTKGCPLKCRWCHNPESISPLPQTGFYQDLCRHCGSCLKVCSANAHTIREGKHLFESAVCRHCGSCEEVCPGNAMKLYGRKVTVKEAFELALEDRDFYEESGGGVTISGGEPTIHPQLPELIRRIRALGFAVKLDTNGSNPKMLKALLENHELDYVAMDIKNAPQAYEQTCGGVDILSRVQESASLLMTGSVDFLFDSGSL